MVLGLERVAELAQVDCRGRVVAGESGDLGDVVLAAVVTGEFTKPRAGLARQLLRLIWAVEHRQQPRTVEQKPRMGRFLQE